MDYRISKEDGQILRELAKKNSWSSTTGRKIREESKSGTPTMPCRGSAP